VMVLRPTETHRDDVSDAGFTLMEVLVALAILSLSLGVLFAAFSQSLDRAHRNQRDMKARLLAQALLEGTVVPGQVRLGQTHGETADGLFWTLDVRPFGTTDDRSSLRSWPVKVTANVMWQDGESRRASKLTTLRPLASPP